MSETSNENAGGEFAEAPLLGCPFCGYVPTGVTVEDDPKRAGRKWYAVRCTCDVMMGISLDDGQWWFNKQDAIKAWNTRAA